MSCGLLLQNPGMFTGMMQKVNPFKSTAQNQVLMVMMIMLYHIAIKHFWTDDFGYVKCQVVLNTLTPCFPNFSPLFQDTQAIHSNLSSSADSLASTGRQVQYSIYTK